MEIMAISKEKREQLIKDGICTKCGYEKAKEGFKLCEKCLESARLYRKRVKNGCDWHDCDTCPHDDCIADENLVQYNNNKIKSRLRKIKQYKKRKENSLCVYCSKPVKNRTVCLDCQKKIVEAIKKYRKRHPKLKAYREEGMCYKCWHRQAVEGYKLCQNCLEKARKICYTNSIKNTERRKENERKLLQKYNRS